MPPDAEKANSPAKWIKHANADLAITRIALPDGAMYEQLCFHAQQATEKSLKALLLFLNIDFPLTHNIQLLIDLLPPDLQSVQVLTDSVVLTPYAVLTRYPGE